MRGLMVPEDARGTAGWYNGGATGAGYPQKWRDQRAIEEGRSRRHVLLHVRQKECTIFYSRTHYRTKQSCKMQVEQMEQMERGKVQSEQALERMQSGNSGGKRKCAKATPVFCFKLKALNGRLRRNPWRPSSSPRRFRAVESSKRRAMGGMSWGQAFGGQL
jgi:hypothetical protein